jgi:hypothetical protein
MRVAYSRTREAVGADLGFGGQTNWIGLDAEGICSAVCPHSPRFFDQRARSWKFKCLPRRRAV